MLGGGYQTHIFKMSRKQQWRGDHEWFIMNENCKNVTETKISETTNLKSDTTEEERASQTEALLVATGK
jgi:hypothetical protein